MPKEKFVRQKAPEGSIRDIGANIKHSNIPTIALLKRLGYPSNLNKLVKGEELRDKELVIKKEEET